MPPKDDAKKKEPVICRMTDSAELWYDIPEPVIPEGPMWAVVGPSGELKDWDTKLADQCDIFTSKDSAESARDEWNKNDCEGHKVVRVRIVRVEE